MEAIGAANQQAIITGGESDELSRKLSLKSSQGGYKVSIIWLPERMNATSANKLLKLLEEPPRRTVFIMVSEAPDNCSKLFSQPHTAHRREAHQRRGYRAGSHLRGEA